MSEIILNRFDHSENVKLNSRPYVVLRSNGPSYINKKTASLLNLENNDSLALYHTPDFKNWYLANDEIGATVYKANGLFRFCDTKLVKKIFNAFGITAKKAFFPVADQVQIINDKKVLYLIPKPFNEK
jgi:hypothetical protein